MIRMFRFGTRSILLATLVIALVAFAYQQTYQYYRSHVFITVARPRTGDIVTQYRYRTRLLFPGVIQSDVRTDSQDDGWQIHSSSKALRLYAPPNAKLELELDCVGGNTSYGSFVNPTVDEKTWTRKLHVTAEVTKRMTGWVFDKSTGLPIANAKIMEGQLGDHDWLNLDDEELPARMPKEIAVTNSDGRFTIAWCKPKQPIVIQHPDYVPLQESIEENGILRLERGVSIRGKLVNKASNQPITDVDVYLIDQISSSWRYVKVATTNEQGEYSCTVKPLQLELAARFFSPSCGIATEKLEPIAEVQLTTYEKELDQSHVSWGRRSRKVNDFGSSIRGEFAIPKGEAKDYRVYLVRSWDEYRTRETSPKNSMPVAFEMDQSTARFQIDNVPWADFWLVVEKRGVPVLVKLISVENDPTDLGLTEIPTSGGIRGVLYDKDGIKPECFGKIWLCKLPVGPRVQFMCDQNGAFEIPQVNPGNYCIYSDNGSPINWSSFLVPMHVTVRPREVTLVDTIDRPLLQIEGAGAAEHYCTISKKDDPSSQALLSIPSQTFSPNGSTSITQSIFNLRPGEYAYEFLPNYPWKQNEAQKIYGSVIVNPGKFEPKKIVLQSRTMEIIWPQDRSIDGADEVANANSDKPTSSTPEILNIILFRNKQVIGQLFQKRRMNLLTFYVDSEMEPDELHLVYMGAKHSGTIQWEDNRWIARPVVQSD